MIKIGLNKHYQLELPEDWTEVPAEYREQVFTWFIAVCLGQMQMFDWQLRTLFLLTGYRPSHATRRALRSGKPVPSEIEYNLIRLAEQLDFPWEEVETSHEDDSAPDSPRRLKIATRMNDAPFPCCTYFRRVTPFIETNLTARQFVDAAELLSLINEPEQPASAVEMLMKKLAEVVGAARTDSMTQNWALTLWMTGVVQYFYDSPRYNVLYSRKKAEETAPAISESRQPESLGDTLLEMQERGYQNPGQMSVEEYHEAQLKMLRDNLRRAVHEGVKPEELSLKTGVPVEFFA